MRTRWLAIVLLGCVAPALAQQPATLDFGAMTDAELRERVVEVTETGFYNACGNEVPLFTEIARRNPAHLGYKSGALTAESICAMSQGRLDEALRLIKEAERVVPVPIQHNVALDVAMRLNDGPEVLARLRSIATSGRLWLMAPELVFRAIGVVRTTGLDDGLEAFAYEFSASEHFQDLEPGVQGNFASAALRHAVTIGDSTRLETLLVYDPNPLSALVMLWDRTYEPFWPQIEAFAGDNLTKVSDSYAGRMAEHLAERPEDRDRLSTYAHALLFAGRFQEAVDVARNWRAERGNPASMEEGDAWAINVEVYALDALGRQAEADRVFDQLVSLPGDRAPWMVNFVINRASRLVGQQRWQEGLVATDLARSVAERYGSTYARMLIARDRACALQHLEMAEQAAREAEYLLEHFATHAPVAATGLLCIGREEQAARMLEDALADDATLSTVVNEMQDPRFELFYTPSKLPRARDLILENEVLRAKVLEHVRILPDRFVPIAYLRRSQ